MITLLCFLMAVLASPFKSKGRLEAENAVLRHQLIVLQRKVQGRVRLAKRGSLVLNPTVSLVPVDPDGTDNHPARDARALASGRLSQLLA